MVTSSWAPLKERQVVLLLTIVWQIIPKLNGTKRVAIVIHPHCGWAQRGSLFLSLDNYKLSFGDWHRVGVTQPSALTVGCITQLSSTLYMLIVSGVWSVMDAAVWLPRYLSDSP